MKKNDIYQYLRQYSKFTFEQVAFNEVDALVLSMLAYLDFSCVEKKMLLLQEAITRILISPDEVKYNGISLFIHNIVSLSEKIALSCRYKRIKVFGYRNITDIDRGIQFAAVTFILPNHRAFLSFRGTDNNLVGWKEDLTLCFKEGIPSQIEATKYTNDIGRVLHMPMYLGGHSKGGNLAVWAATHMDMENKNIAGVFSNDGPGFSSEFLCSREYLRIRGKIHSYVPRSSVIGVLMNHDAFKTIKSYNPSILSHDPLSWKIIGTHFDYDEKRAISSRQFERVINAWIRSMSPEERKSLIESLFQVIQSSNAKTLNELDERKIRSLIRMQKAFRELGIRKQAELLRSVSKVFFNRNIFFNLNYADGAFKSTNLSDRKKKIFHRKNKGDK